MRFVHPEALWGMLSLAIPIIVHLFNFRKFRKVAFSNVAFLKEIRQETHKTRNLKHLLILLARLLALGCIVFAFSRPYLSSGESQMAGASAVSVYIDNSLSMEARGYEGVLLENAKSRAIDIAESFGASDKFQLLTSDFEGRHQRFVSRDEFIQRVQEIQLGSSSRMLSDVAERQRDALQRAEQKNRFIFQLTDLQKTTSDPKNLPCDSAIQCTILSQVGEVISNVYIDSVWFESPVHTISRIDELHIRLFNTGSDERKDIPIRWKVNEVQRSVGTINIPGNSSAETILSCSFTESGKKECRIEIDDSGILLDDQYFFNYEVMDVIPVLEIRGKDCTSNAVAAVFNEDPYFSYHVVSENQIDFASINQYNLIVLHQPKSIANGLQVALQNFVNSGGSIILLPSPFMDIASCNSILEKLGAGSLQPFIESHNSVKDLNSEHPLIRDAFEKTDEPSQLPEVNGYFPYTLGANAQSIATLATGEPFISLCRSGHGIFYLITSPDDIKYNALVRNALFPAILIRMAESSAPSSPIAYELGNGVDILLRHFRGREEGLQLKNILNGASYKPELRSNGLDAIININAEMRTAGNYHIVNGDSSTYSISLNQNRVESDNRPWSIDAFQTTLDSLSISCWRIFTSDTDTETLAANLQNARANGSSLWYMLMVWSLIFLAIEVLLLKFWR